MKIYAYVTGQSCLQRKAFAPGEEYQGQPVSKHGDVRPWYHGKRETLRRAAGQIPAHLGAGNDIYEIATARKVAYLLDWE